MSQTEPAIQQDTRDPSKYDDLPTLKSDMLIKKHSYRQQYASIYYIRLSKLRQATLESSRKRWENLSENPSYVQKILDIQVDQLCYIIGTIYLEMPGKPNVMKNLQDENSIVRPETPVKYRSDDDVVSLEDESGRVEIHGSCLSKEFLVTGMVVGILGKESTSGTFEALDICLPGMASQDPLPEDNESKYVALLSGLNLGGENDMKAELLSEFLTGQLGSPADQKSASTISRVILAGNSIAKVKKTVDPKKPKKYGYDSSSFDASPMIQLDELLEEIGSTIDIDIMPGPTDPAPSHLPQQPMHQSMFKNAHRLSTFNSVSNPYWCDIDGVRFLGTAGQNIDDIYRYVESVDRIKMAETCIYWRHMAPSAPDTLWAYPFADKDPFIIERTPHVYFIGNQPQFEDSLLLGPNGQKIRVILVPSFSETGVMVLLNLKTLECSSVLVDIPNIKQDDMDTSS